MLIVAPVLIMMANMCTIVTAHVYTVLVSLLERADVASVTLKSEAIISAASSHAAIAEVIFADPISDLHLLTRVAGWLLFGGLKQAGSSTDMTQATDECKLFPLDWSCGFFSEDNRVPCHCGWEDPPAIDCLVYVNERRR
jgi:hypothetical protein